MNFAWLSGVICTFLIFCAEMTAFVEQFLSKLNSRHRNTHQHPRPNSISADILAQTYL